MKTNHLNTERKTNNLKQTKEDAALPDLMQNVLGGNFLTRNTVVRQLPFLLFVTMLGLTYIANIYYAEKNIREIDLIKTDMKELRYEHISTKSILMQSSRQSEVIRRLKETGIKEAMEPPYQIFK